MDHNLEWEDKNIILSLFLYLTLNYKELKDKVIIINHQFFMNIIKEFFFKLTFKHKDDDKYQNKVHIYIKEISKNSGLYINNIHNFESIYNYKISLIPWYDIQNPLIMFYKEKGKQVMDKDDVYKSIIKFNKHLRYKNYNMVGLNKYRCSVNVWDSYYEIEIMKKFCLLYGLKNPFYINGYINRIVGCRLCKNSKDIKNLFLFEAALIGLIGGIFGIGLSYVKTIVDAHKGSVSLKSKLKQGTTITINIPSI